MIKRSVTSSREEKVRFFSISQHTDLWGHLAVWNVVIVPSHVDLRYRCSSGQFAPQSSEDNFGQWSIWRKWLAMARYVVWWLRFLIAPCVEGYHCETIIASKRIECTLFLYPCNLVQDTGCLFEAHLGCEGRQGLVKRRPTFIFIAVTLCSIAAIDGNSCGPQKKDHACHVELPRQMRRNAWTRSKECMFLDIKICDTILWRKQ